MSASVFRLASVGETVRLSWRTNDGNNGLFPQAVVVGDTGAIVATKNLSVISVAGVAGAYEVSYTPTTNGEFNIYYSVYTSSANRTAQTPVSELYEGNTEVLKVRSFPVYGNNAAFGGFTDDDVRPILKAISDIWKYKLLSGRTVEEELIAKSEFDSESQVVKTDIKIPDEINLKPIESKLDSLLEKVPHLSQIKAEIKAIKMPDYNPIIDNLASTVTLIESLKPQIASANNIEAINNLAVTLLAQQESIKALDNKEVPEKIVQTNQVIISTLETLQGSVKEIGLISSLQDKFDSINKSISETEKNLKQLSGSERVKVEGLVGQLRSMLHGMADDIGNIKEKDGILANIKKLAQI